MIYRSGALGPGPWQDLEVLRGSEVVCEAQWPAIVTPDLESVREWAAQARLAGQAWLPVRWAVGYFAVGPLISPNQSGCLQCLQTREGALDRGAVPWPTAPHPPEEVWPQVLAYLKRRSPRPRTVELLGREGPIGQPNYLVPVPDCSVCGAGPVKRALEGTLVRRGLGVASVDGGWRVTEPGATLRAIERHVGMICGQVGWVRARQVEASLWLGVATGPEGCRLRSYGATPEQAMVGALGRVFERLSGEGEAVVRAGVWFEEGLLPALCRLVEKELERDPAQLEWRQLDGMEVSDWEERLWMTRAIEVPGLIRVHPQREVAMQRLSRARWDARHGDTLAGAGGEWIGLHEIEGTRPLPNLWDVGLIDEAIDDLVTWLKLAGVHPVWWDASRMDIPLALAAVRSSEAGSCAG